MSDIRSVGHAQNKQPTAQAFSVPPTKPTISLRPFRPNIPEQALDDLRARLNTAADILPTYENSYAHRTDGVHTPEKKDAGNAGPGTQEYECMKEGQIGRFGVTKDWLDQAIEYWRTDFDWRKVEARINSVPNFTTTLETRGHTFTVHFAALFSEKKDAVPIVMTHGWPGSFLEFVPLMNHLQSTYKPSELPVHIVCPSIVGFGFSSYPPRHDYMDNLDCAALNDALMRGLGFSKYVAQGGDIGSYISRIMGEKYESCAAVHVNMFAAPRPKSFDATSADEFDKKCLARLDYFDAHEFAYHQEHGTKAATISAVVESSPVAMLAWIGEKFLVWSDKSPDQEEIISGVSLYWLTRTFPTSIYHYRVANGFYARKEAAPGNVFLDKPTGYSLFHKEIHPTPLSWAKEKANIVWHKRHEQGGHFAALEQPVQLWEDVHDFVKQVWPL